MEKSLDEWIFFYYCSSRNDISAVAGCMSFTRIKGFVGKKVYLIASDLRVKPKLTTAVFL